MIVDETEAKRLWCPMARVVVSSNEGPATANRLGDYLSPDGYVKDLSANCLGSGCMAWIPASTRGRGSCGLARL